MTRLYYRDWLIEFDPKPFACRNFDWTATSPDYDAWTESGLWTDNAEKASADSREALEAEIDAMIDDEAVPSISARFGICLALLVAAMIGAHAAWAATL